MNEDRGLRGMASLPVGLSEALAFYDALAEWVGQEPGVGAASMRDEARRRALEANSDWTAELREHFRLEDCLLGVNDSPFDSTHLGLVGESVSDSQIGSQDVPHHDGGTGESRELALARRLRTAAATMRFVPRYMLGMGGQGEV